VHFSFSERMSIRVILIIFWHLHLLADFSQEIPPQKLSIYFLSAQFVSYSFSCIFVDFNVQTMLLKLYKFGEVVFIVLTYRHLFLGTCSLCTSECKPMCCNQPVNCVIFKILWCKNFIEGTKISILFKYLCFCSKAAKSYKLLIRSLFAWSGPYVTEDHKVKGNISYCTLCYCQTCHVAWNLTGEHQSSISNSWASLLPHQGEGEGTYCSWEL